jgi:hypothetical protein
VLCSPEHPVPVVSRFTARIVTFAAMKQPIIPGFQVPVRCGAESAC